MLQSQVITLPKQRDPNYEPPLQKVAVLAGSRAKRSTAADKKARAASWAPGKRVSFATMAGSAEASPVDKWEETALFLQNHPTLDLYNLLGVREGCAPKEVLPAFRKKARVIHPDKFAGAPEEVRERKSNEFKLLTAARDILLDPFTAAHYARWFRSQRARPSAAGVPPAKASSAAGAPARSQEERHHGATPH